jgi:hypothetical protein
VHFHRANPRDSSPVITPFVHVGIYPTRNYALLFLNVGPYLLPLLRSTAYGLFVPCFGLTDTLLYQKVALNG